MQVVWALFHMFPDANNNNTEVIASPDGTWEITKWELPVLKPSKDDVINYWNENQQAILDANKQPPSEMDDIKRQFADLSYTLMMNGVV